MIKLPFCGKKPPGALGLYKLYGQERWMPPIRAATHPRIYSGCWRRLHHGSGVFEMQDDVLMALYERTGK